MGTSNIIYLGKEKSFYKTQSENEVVMYHNDDLIAYNGLKKATFINKGIYCSKITALIFELLEKNGVKTHYIKTINERELLCKKAEIIPVRMVVRNMIAGSLAKRLKMKEGTPISNIIYEFTYKKDELGEEWINEHHAVALGICDYDRISEIYSMSLQINKVLREHFKKCGIFLVDFKLVFGITADGELVLVDEISPDTCRLWDIKTGNRLDKDRFRKDLGHIVKAYEEVYNRLIAIKE